jgi:hypothetical protein
VERIPKSRTSGSKSPIADIVAVDSMAQKETTSLGASSSNPLESAYPQIFPELVVKKCMKPHI